MIDLESTRRFAALIDGNGGATEAEEGYHRMRTQALIGQRVAVRRDQYGYRINGHFYRRVTTLLGGLPKPALTGWAAKRVAEYAVENRDAWVTLPKRGAIDLLKREPMRTRDDAGEHGTAVHAAIEAHITGVRRLIRLTEEQQACVGHTARFLNWFVDDTCRIGTELTVVNPTVGYAGTLDLCFRGTDGDTWIVDLKTGNDVYNDHAVQLTAYQRAEYVIPREQGTADEFTGTLKPFDGRRVRRLGILHVRPEGATLHEVVPSERLWHVFRAAGYVKRWQLDTDAYNRAPRERVFLPPVEIATPENGENAA